MTPVLETRQVVTLEQRAASVGVQHHALETSARDLATSVLDLYNAFTLERGLHAGFYAWCETHASIPRATAHRYLQVGIAVRAGHAGSILELEAAGRGKAAGMTDGEITAGLADGTIRDKAEARANAGLVRLPVPEWGVGLQRELHQRFPAVAEPELVGLAIQFAHSEQTAFSHFVERES